MSRYPPPNFQDVVSEVTGFHTHLQSYETPADVTPFTSFQIQHSDVNNTQRGHGYSSGRSRYKGRGGGYSTRGRGFSQQEKSSGWNQQTQGSESTQPTCQICGRIGHTALKY